MISLRRVAVDLRLFLLAVVAGFVIGVGGIVFLSLDNKIVGALIFTVGLYAICTQGLNLFTGKVGYLPNRDLEYVIDLLDIWFGNLIGTVLASSLVLATRTSSISEKAQAMCETKLNDGYVSLLLLGVFCGILMYIAVDGYAQTKNPIILFMGVATFILSGFEHCIADMFYFSVAGMWSFGALCRIVTITVGNAIGGVIISLIKKIRTDV